MGRDAEKNNSLIMFLLKCLLVSYLLTAVCLLLLTFLLYKFGLSEKAVSVAIIIIYVISTLTGGYVAGKKLQNKKFLWGLLLGTVYFLILVAVSMMISNSPGEIGDAYLTTLILCAGGGMLGGMLG